MSISTSVPVIFDKKIGYLALAVSLPSSNGDVDTILTDTENGKSIMCYNRYSFQANDKIEPFPNFINFVNDDAYFSSRSFNGTTAASGCLDTFFVTAPIFATLTIEQDSAFTIRFTYPNDSKNTNYKKFDDVVFRQTQSQLSSIWANAQSFYFSSQNLTTFYLPLVKDPTDTSSSPTLSVYNIFESAGGVQNYTLFFELWKVVDEKLLTQYDATKYTDATNRTNALQQISGQDLCSLKDPSVILIPIFATKKSSDVPLLFYIFDPSIQSIPPESFQLFEENIVNSLAKASSTAAPFRVPDDKTYFIFGFILFSLPSGVQNSYLTSPGITSNLIMGYSKVANTTEQTFTCSEFLNETCSNLPCKSSDAACST